MGVRVKGLSLIISIFAENSRFMKHLKLQLFIFLTFLICLQCHSQGKIHFEGKTQGTFYHITYYDPDSVNYQKQIDSMLADFNRTASLYDSMSIISRINRNEEKVLLNNDFIHIFKKSMEVSFKSDGYFDITVGPLVNAFGFGLKERIRMDSATVKSILEFVGYKLVYLEGNRLIKKDKRVLLDFNAIAQGYSVDKVGRFLESKGVKNYLIEIGGEVLARGTKPDHRKWLVGIEKPAADEFSGQQIGQMACISDKAIATSGNYRKFYIENGIKFSHTIDPKTGYPVHHSLLSVTVLACDCTTADAFATAFMVMGKEKALKVLRKNKRLEAYFISSGINGTYEIDMTPGFKKLIMPE